MHEFLLVCVPAEDRLAEFAVGTLRYEQNPALVGGARESPAMTLLRGGAAGVEMLWPPGDRANGGTVLLDIDDTAGRFLVPSTPNARAVTNGQNSDLLLFLRDPPAGHKLLITREGSRPRRFERGHVEARWFPTPRGAWTTRCPIFIRSFASVGGNARAGFTPLRLEVDAGARDQPPAAILNPLVFRVALAGNELAQPGASASGEVTFASALRALIAAARAPGGMLHVEPVIPIDVDPRIHGLESIAQRSDGRSATSVAEELLLGMPGTDGWLAFLCLDLLPGRFRLDNPAGCGDGSWKSWGFLPGTPPAANADWFARYWVGRWGGRYEEVEAAEDDAVIQLPPEERDPDQRERFSATKLVLPKSDFDAVFGNCRRFLERFDAAEHPFLAWARDALHGLPAITSHQQFIRRERARAGAHPVSARLDGLMQALAELLLFPQSPVLVQPPPAESIPDPALRTGYERHAAHRLFDLRRSVRWSARDFARRVTATEPGLATPIRWRDGWWLEWYDHLFVPGAGRVLTFVADDGGFVIGESRLGLDSLGAGGGRYEQGDLMVI